MRCFVVLVGSSHSKISMRHYKIFKDLNVTFKIYLFIYLFALYLHINIQVQHKHINFISYKKIKCTFPLKRDKI